MTLAIHEGHLTLEEQLTLGKGVASVDIQRHVHGPGVQRVPVRHGRLRGTLFMPPGPGPFPGIIDLTSVDGNVREFLSGLCLCQIFMDIR